MGSDWTVLFTIASLVPQPEQGVSSAKPEQQQSC